MAGYGSKVRAPPSCDTTRPIFVDLTSDLATTQGSQALISEKLRCMYPECQDSSRSYNREYDLKRHEKEHDPDATVWQCGCCQNQGEHHNGTKRKDKLPGHLIKEHNAQRVDGRFPGILCKVPDCHTLFSTALCLDKHLRQKHPEYPVNALERSINGEKIW